MIRLARRASLVVTLFLAPLGTASAEGAWVLWQESVTSNKTEWTVLYVATSETACRARAEQEYAAASVSHDARKDDTHLGVGTARDGREVQQHFHCFPATIDPRGPKAK